MLRERDSFWAASSSAWLSWYFCFHSARTWSDRSYQSIKMTHSATLLSLHVYRTRIQEAWPVLKSFALDCSLPVTINSLRHLLWQNSWWQLLKLFSSASTSAFPKLSGRTLVWCHPGHNVVSLNEAAWAFLLLQEPVVLHSAHQERSCSTDCLLSLIPQPCRASFFSTFTQFTHKRLGQGTGVCNITGANYVDSFKCY